MISKSTFFLCQQMESGAYLKVMCIVNELRQFQDVLKLLSASKRKLRAEKVKVEAKRRIQNTALHGI